LWNPCKIEKAAFRLKIGKSKHLVRYSDNIMTVHPQLDTPPDQLDPIGFTRRLCEIESTTYHEGAVGDFLAEFLAGRGWAVEKTPVEQPAENAGGGPRWNVYAGVAGQTPDLVFSTHMDTALYSLQ
jgi:acetylornithine deacetylase/succinyl-diaminopimelate desuccinylase-like protein